MTPSTIEQELMVLQAHLDAARAENASLQGGKKASAARVRANLMKLKNGSHNIRKTVMDFSKTIPVKSRVKKTAAIADELPEIIPLERQETVPVETAPKPKPKPKPKTKKPIKAKPETVV